MSLSRRPRPHAPRTSASPSPHDPPAAISLLVTTYNWKQALQRVLESVARQTRRPDEVIVADHARVARRGSFIQGSRVLTGPSFRDRILASAEQRPTPLARDIVRRRNALRSLPLSDAWLAANRNTVPHAIKTCNQGWWRDDLVRLNGFDERMEGWGREDVELAWRAHNAGIACRQLRFAGLAYHLHHEERHQDGASPNDRYVSETRALGSIRCAHGLDAHLGPGGCMPLRDLRDGSPGSAAA